MLYLKKLVVHLTFAAQREWMVFDGAPVGRFPTDTANFSRLEPLLLFVSLQGAPTGLGPQATAS